METASARRQRRRRAGLLRLPAVLIVLCLGALGLIGAACGGSSPGVASYGATTTTSSANTSQVNESLVGFAHCMRAHGVPYFPIPSISTVRLFKRQLASDIDQNSSQFRLGYEACRRLLPSVDEGPNLTPGDQADYLRGVHCMRSHGFPQFPDPTISRNQVSFQIPASIDRHSKQFEDAVAICDKLIPAGLPYSGNDSNGS